MESRATQNLTARKSLERRWAVYAFVAVLLLGLGYWFLRVHWSPAHALRWLTLAALLFAYLLWMLRSLLNHNHRQGEDLLLPTFGPGNALSLLRGALIVLIAGFLFSPRPTGVLAWLPAALYVLSDFTDFFDGYLARVSDHATRLGETLDVNLDALGVLVVTLLAYQYGTLPFWYLPVGFARYLFLFGLWLRRRRGQPVYELRPSVARRGFAGLQMGFITVMLFPVISPPASTIGAALFMTPFLVGFLYDWLSVSGALEPASPRTARFWRSLWRFSSHWLPLALRAAAVFVLALWLSRFASAFTAQGGLLFAELEAFFLVMLAVGAAGRVVSVLALIFTGIQLQFEPLTLEHWAVLVACTGLLFLGTGAFSLWQPMEWLVRHHAGERSSS